MKTVRFSQLVKKAGKPSVHLQLAPAGKDSELQRAAKQHRVVTVNQSSVGHAADFGVVGLDLELRGQILVFPRSLAKFAGLHVVGIKYDLLEEPPIPKGALAAKVRPKKKKKGKTKRASTHALRISRPPAAPISEAEVEREHEPEVLPKKESTTSPKAAPASSRKKSAAGKKVKAFTKRSGSVVSPHQKRRKEPSTRPTQSHIKRALRALEEGQSVKAYNILKELMDD